MRINSDTIILAEIRRIIRCYKKYLKLEDMPKSWDNENYKKAHVTLAGGKAFYYSKVTRAIEDLAKKILINIRKTEKKIILKKLSQ
jgi:hypothetical protein